MIDKPNTENEKENANGGSGDSEEPMDSRTQRHPSNETDNPTEDKHSPEEVLKPAYEWVKSRALPKIGRIIFRSNVWTAAATVVIAWATITYTHYAKKQWETMDRQLSDLEAYERANLVLTFHADWPSETSPIQIHCTIWNAGQTTALNMAISTGAGGGGKIPLDENGNRTVPPIGVNGVPNPSEAGPSLGQNEKQDCSWTQTFPPSDRQYLTSVWFGDIVQIFTVSVSYKDVFGKSWIVNDCLVYWVKFRGSGHGIFSQCPMQPITQH